MNVLSSFVSTLPKIELHAHLTGSVPRHTIRRIQCTHKDGATATAHTESQNPLSTSVPFSAVGHTPAALQECFALFSVLHQLLSDVEALKSATRDVIESFAADEVIYLELRTTPRALTTLDDYVSAIVDVIKHCESTVFTPSGCPIVVRLLLSVDRSQSLSCAYETLYLARKWSKTGYVCGLDFSGNPAAQSFHVFLPVFASARDAGLKVSVHCAEILDDTDTREILQFKPDRLGHMCCISQDNMARALKSRIPIEICPTSNLATRAFSSLDQHIFFEYFQHQHPLIICTDDAGIFNITLSQEYAALAQVFQLSKEQLWQLCESSQQYMFCSDANVTAQVADCIKRRKIQLQKQEREQHADQHAQPGQK